MTFLVFITLHGLMSFILASAKEYCNLESFKATCPRDHVILITSAKYGRMKLGRCLTRDYYVGCGDDVTAVLHERCSGKRQCEVPMPDTDLYEQQQCPKDLVSYLEADYSCLKVTHFPNSTCLDKKFKIDLRESGGFLAGSQAVTSPYGITSQNDCSLELRAPPGQRINITLYEFSNSDVTKLLGNNIQYQCFKFAIIKEYNGQSFREHFVCGSGRHRQELVFSSKTNVVIIQLNPEGRIEDGKGPRFLLQYEATGCRDPEIPSDMVLNRRDDQMDVRCNFTGQVWHLVCRGSAWVGEFGNCTTDYGGAYIDNNGGSRGHLGIKNGIVMAIIVGIVLGVMIGFCLLLVVYHIRRKRKNEAKRRAHPGVQHAQQGHMTTKFLEGSYGVHDPMLPVLSPDVTLDKGCHVVCDVSGTMLPRGRDRDHVYEKPQSGMEVQCLLSSGQTVRVIEDEAYVMKALENGDYGCHLHRPKQFQIPPERFEMTPPTKCSLPS